LQLFFAVLPFLWIFHPLRILDPFPPRSICFFLLFHWFLIYGTFPSHFQLPVRARFSSSPCEVQAMSLRSFLDTPLSPSRPIKEGYIFFEGLGESSGPNPPSPRARPRRTAQARSAGLPQFIFASCPLPSKGGSLFRTHVGSVKFFPGAVFFRFCFCCFQNWQSRPLFLMFLTPPTGPKNTQKKNPPQNPPPPKVGNPLKSAISLFFQSFSSFPPLNC